MCKQLSDISFNNEFFLQWLMKCNDGQKEPKLNKCPVMAQTEVNYIGQRYC